MTEFNAAKVFSLRLALNIIALATLERMVIEGRGEELEYDKLVRELLSDPTLAHPLQLKESEQEEGMSFYTLSLAVFNNTAPLIEMLEEYIGTKAEDYATPLFAMNTSSNANTMRMLYATLVTARGERATEKELQLASTFGVLADSACLAEKEEVLKDFITVYTSVIADFCLFAHLTPEDYLSTLAQELSLASVA